MSSMVDESLEEQVKKLYLECNELKRQLNENEFIHDNKVEDLKLEIEEHKKTIQDLNRNLKSVKSELEESVDIEKYHKLEQQLDEESRKTERLVYLNDKYEKLLKEQTEELALAKKEINQKDNEMESMRLTLSQMASMLDKYEQIESQLKIAKDNLEESDKEKRLLREEMVSLREQVKYFSELPRRSMNESFLSIVDERENRSLVFSPAGNKSCGPETMAAIFDVQLRETESELNSCKAVLSEKDEEIKRLRESIDSCKGLEKELEDIKAEREKLLTVKSCTMEELQKQKDKVSNLEKKLMQKTNELKDSYKEITVIQSKFEERQQRYSKSVCEIKKKLSDKESQLHSLQMTIESLQRENSQMFHQLANCQREIKRLEEECKLNEDSFKLERIHKERFRREAESLEEELRKMKSQNQASKSNMTFVMPTTVNVNGGDEAAAFIHAMSNSFPREEYGRSVNGRSGPSSIASSFLVADEEESEFMNPKNLSDLKEGRCNTGKDLDISRLSTLQRRNTLVPPHLQSSYPIELNNANVPGFTEDSIRRGSQMEHKAIVLRGIENQNQSKVDPLNSSVRSLRLRNTSVIHQSTSSHFLLSCTPSKLVKRVRNSKKWTPSKAK